MDTFGKFKKGSKIEAPEKRRIEKQGGYNIHTNLTRNGSTGRNQESRPAEAPWRLVIVTILQFSKGITLAPGEGHFSILPAPG
jgi:hypothetical protein